MVDEQGEDYDGDDGFWSESGFRGREGEKDYDRDPEFAEIIGTSVDDPEKARSKVKLSYLFLVNRLFIFVFYFILNILHSFLEHCFLNLLGSLKNL